ncbi:MAG: murein biosynthesis integral membrane protein MurJ, partial [candidate division Zixibacteria bacterium]|nr:murein biosynthesis integral membrane protein MurJ [candidate division Zixibacteria bacterium]
RIPNLLRDLFAEGALSSAFVPIFKEKLIKDGKTEAFRLASLVISALILVVGIVVAIGILFTPSLVFISAKGFLSNPAKFELTIALTRIMFIYLLMVSISAVLMGILNSVGKFGIPALSPALFNIGMILSPVILYNYFDIPIYTMALGVLIGGVGQLVFQVPLLLNIGFRFKFAIKLADEGIRRIVRLITPMILGLSASRINILINTLLASLLIEGAMSYLNFAYRLMHFPLGVFAVAVGTVALPKLSGEVARNQIDQLIKIFNESLGLTMFLVIPSAVYLAGFSDDLVRLIYERGAFGAEATTNTSFALLFYAFGLLGFAGVRVTAPAYYAMGDAKRPMHYSIFTVALNIGLNFVFIPLWGFAGLAMATSVAGTLNFALLLFNLRKKIPDLKFLGIFFGIIRMIFAAVTSYYIINIIDFGLIFIGHEGAAFSGIGGKILVVASQISGMGILYLIFSKVLQLDEINRLLGLVFKRKK